MNCCLKRGFQLIQILGLLGMYFDAVVVKVNTFLLLFRLALAILCLQTYYTLGINKEGILKIHGKK